MYDYISKVSITSIYSWYIKFRKLFIYLLNFAILQRSYNVASCSVLFEHLPFEAR